MAPPWDDMQFVNVESSIMTLSKPSLIYTAPPYSA